MTPDFLIIFTMVVGILNLPTAYITREDTAIRSFMLLAVSIFFCANILILDFLFLQGIEAKITIFDIGKYSIAFHLEAIGLIFLTMMSVLWICALLYTIKFLSVNQMIDTSRFLFFVNGAVLSGSIVALSANLFTMFIGYEMLTICTIPLIGHKGGYEVSKGLFDYLKILMISSLVLFLPAVIIIYANIGHGNFVNGGFMRGAFPDKATLFLLLMFIFGISKAAIYPLHKWLPVAMVASYPVSALLHAVVVVKTGLFCIYKILLYVFGLDYLTELFMPYNWLMLLPVFTIIYSSLQALRYNQIKMILAYSTINQLSIALVSAFLLTPKGIAAAVLHMVSHSFTKICLFYSAGNIYSVKNAYQVSQLIGIKNTMPKTSLVLLIAGLSLIGIPPFAGFISKFYILMAAAETQNLFVMIVISISTLFSAIYMIRILIFVYRPTKSNFHLNLKLNPYFDQTAKHKLSKRVVSTRYRAEDKLPLFMTLSLTFCLSGVVLFFFIQQIISKFLIYI